MSTPRQDPLFAFVFAVWGALFTWSIVGFVTNEPAGDGFTRGLNRITQFLVWQFAAGAVAIPVFVMGRAATRDRLVRLASAVPLAFALLLLVALAGVMIWAWIAH